MSSCAAAFGVGGLGHAPAAEHGEGVLHRDLVVGQELGDGQVVGVVGAQVSIGVHDRDHRSDPR
jgi:hypothetical protein